ncbi:MAG: hypothetical protein ACOYN0_06435 [Phycisphaerales bacterium]
MRFATLAFGLTAALMLSACASSNKSASAGVMEDESKCEEVKPGKIESVNALCVIMPSHPVNPATKCADFNGQKIGFCCTGCIPKWEKLSAAEKQSKLAAAQSAAKK